MSNPSGDDRTRIGPTRKTNPTQPVQGPAPGDFDTGAVIGGSYKILSLIGRGGMGSVFRVHHLFLDKQLALKTLSGDQITEVAWRRFQIEGQAIARLDHANIIRIYDLGITPNNQPYYVMDLVEGISLAQLIESQGALKPSFVLPVFRQVAAGLAFAHERNIIHRDLKPGNIMILGDTNTNSSATNTQPVAAPTAKILDFGLAKLTDLASGGASGLTKTGEIFGSPLYMSPEQAQGLSTDLTTDMYSFGCTLYEALTGKPPLKGANAIETMLMHQNKTPLRLSEARPDLEFSPDLERVVAKLMAKEPANRYRSFAEIASQLLSMERSRDMAVTHAYTLKSEPGTSSGGQRTGEFTDPPAPSITSKKWFWPTLTACGILFLIGLATGSYHLFAKPAPTKPKEIILPPSSLTLDKKAIFKDTAVTWERFSHVDKTTNGELRIFEFPATSIGAITVELSKFDRDRLTLQWQQNHTAEQRNPYRNDGIPAEGEMSFPVNQPLGFKPDPEICNTPVVFKKFSSEDLSELNLDHNDYVDSDFLSYIKHLKGLHSLSMQETAVDDRAIKVLDSLPHLARLDIDNTKITGEALSKSALIKTIVHLSYAGGSDVSKLIKAMDHFANVAELRLNGARLTSEDVEILARMPNLHKLCINDCGVGDEGLKIIATSQSISNLDIVDKALTPKSIETLVTMHLSKLDISGIGWSKDEQDDLRAAMAKKSPPCNVIIRSDDY